MPNNKDSEKLVRRNKICVHLNDKEYNVLKNYIEKYNIPNTSKLIRQALFTYILEQYDKDYPSLFSKENIQQNPNNIIDK